MADTSSRISGYCIPHSAGSPGRSVRVFIPKKPFRIHPQPGFPCRIWYDPEAGQWLIFHVDVARHSFDGGLKLSKATLYPGVDQSGALFLLPVVEPVEGGPTSWHDAWSAIIPVARTRWVTVTKNQRAQRHDWAGAGDFGTPRWSCDCIVTQAEDAFRGRTVSSLEHPLVAGRLKRSRCCDEIEEEA